MALALFIFKKVEKSMKAPMWAVGLLAMFAVGCVQGSTTAGSALLHTHFPYAVTYDDAATKSLLGDEWILENYRRREQSTDIERKEGYSLTYELDFDDDDKADFSAELPFPDLLLIHKRTNARLEVSTLLLDKRIASKELRVLLQDLVASRSGARSLLLGFNRVAVGIEKRFATRLVDSAEATLGGEKGLVATLERADLDQLQIDPKARWQRSRLFMMHAPFELVVPRGIPSESQEPWALEKTTTTKQGLSAYRVLLLVEYTNTPEDFEAQYPEFLRLLGKTHVLTDEMLVTYLIEPLSLCGGRADKGHLELEISPFGTASVRSVTGVDQECAANVFAPFRFAGAREPRRLTRELDFTKPANQSWLAEGGYLEQRQPLPEVTAPAESPAAASPVPPAPEPAPPVPATTPPDAPPPAVETPPAPPPTTATPVAPQ